MAGLGVAATDAGTTTGAVLSMLTPTTDSGIAVPDRARQTKLLDWPAPSVLIVCDEAGITGPESASVHVKLVVTSVFVQPLEFGSGVRNAVPTGDVRSILRTTEFEIEPPSLTAVHVSSVPP